MDTYGNNLMAHFVVTFVGYFLFGGWRLFASHRAADGATLAPRAVRGSTGSRWASWRRSSLGVIFFNFQVGMAALTGATILSLRGAGRRKGSHQAHAVGCGPDGVRRHGAHRRAREDAGHVVSSPTCSRACRTPSTVTGVVAFVTGIVSVYSSTSGVVLPAFLPTVPGLVERLGGGDPMAMASSMIVGGHLVDLSPLSTIGALCIAALPGNSAEESRTLFNQLLAWGLSMTVVGTAACWLLF